MTDGVPVLPEDGPALAALVAAVPALGRTIEIAVTAGATAVGMTAEMTAKKIAETTVTTGGTATATRRTTVALTRPVVTAFANPVRVPVKKRPKNLRAKPRPFRSDYLIDD